MNSLNLLLTFAGVLRQADAVLFVPASPPFQRFGRGQTEMGEAVSPSSFL